MTTGKLYAVTHYRIEALAEFPEDHKYSSAKFYESGADEFDLLTHYNE